MDLHGARLTGGKPIATANIPKTKKTPTEPDNLHLSGFVDVFSFLQGWLSLSGHRASQYSVASGTFGTFALSWGGVGRGPGPRGGVGRGPSL